MHDLDDIYEGDLSAKVTVDTEIKLQIEEVALNKLTAQFRQKVQQTFKDFGWNIIKEKPRRHN